MGEPTKEERKALKKARKQAARKEKQEAEAAAQAQVEAPSPAAKKSKKKRKAEEAAAAATEEDRDGHDQPSSAKVRRARRGEIFKHKEEGRVWDIGSSATAVEARGVAVTASQSGVVVRWQRHDFFFMLF